jgi:hypothetical protein
MVPVPVGAKTAPLPTNIAAALFVALVIPLNATLVAVAAVVALVAVIVPMPLGARDPVTRSAPENVFAPPMVWVVLRSTKFCVADPVPPWLIGNAAAR